MKKPSLPKPITILVLTLLTAILWVGLNIYRAVTIKPPQSVPEDILKALNPTLNTSALDWIDSGIYFEDADISEISIGQTKTPIPTPVSPEAPTNATESTESALPE